MKAQPTCGHGELEQQACSYDRGSISIETILVVPAFLLFLALIVGVGRVSFAAQDVHAAAVQGARVASLQSDPTTGDDLGTQAIRTHLAREGIACARLDVSVDASALGQDPGMTGAVTARVTCVVPLADLLVPGLPGQLSITEEFAAQIDSYVDR